MIKPVVTPDKFCIKILPIPTDASKVAELYFTSSDVKNTYVSDEFKFCSVEYEGYCAAMSLDARAAAFQVLSDKRVAFARKRGYVPLKGNSKVWKYVQEITK